jgi:hypothetical protein
VQDDLRALDRSVRDRVMTAIWEHPDAATTSVWAILDCARDERIYPALRLSGLDYRCLYSGRLSHAMERNAPYLVELGPTYKFSARLIESGWGQSWGVFLRIADPSNLRHHLRTFLRVRDESGRILLFRYYDPRVLRAYLPTCRREELQAVFGPVSSFMTESDRGDSVLEFTFDGQELRERRIAVAAMGAAGTPPAEGQVPAALA